MPRGFVITEDERTALLWAGRQAEAAIEAGDIRRARELIGAQHAIIEAAWQRTVLGGSAALSWLISAPPG